MQNYIAAYITGSFDKQIERERQYRNENPTENQIKKEIYKRRPTCMANEKYKKELKKS